LWAQNPFYRDRLHPVSSWEDFQRLPLLTKSDIVADQAAHPPFGSNLSHPLAEFVRLHQTSGSSGSRPIRWLDTAESWQWWERIWAEHVFPAAGVGPRDRVFCAFSFGPFIGFWSAFCGAERLGALAISGGAMSSEQRVRAILELGVTVLCCTPTYALRLAEVGESLGLDLPSSAVRSIICAGEPGASIPATREKIERSFGARLYDHSGMTELGPTGFGCSAGGGIHLVQSEFIFEVSPDGELIATNLGRWGSPLIRYRTGDRVELATEPCACGSQFAKLAGGIRGRLDDMFTVRGVNLYPSQVEDIVRRQPQVVEFLIEHRTVRQMDEVVVLVEVDPAVGLPDSSTVIERLAADLRLALGARIGCRAVAAGTLPREELKAKRLRRVIE
ncbi:MAG: phenylacetate--CoA ligase family protein, partial [Candidatus Dormibacteraeota bacterium]|nr:phenylacetate--CoA ligase family protein [Candidatus Dormibacteraeota bacterium]